MDKQRLAAAVAAACLSASCLAGEPQAMVYLMVPFGQAPQFGLMLRSRDAMRPMPVLDFRLSYRPKADAAAAAVATTAPNWWIVGGVAALAAVLIANDKKSNKPPADDPPPFPVGP